MRRTKTIESKVPGGRSILTGKGLAMLHASKPAVVVVAVVPFTFQACAARHIQAQAPEAPTAAANVLAKFRIESDRDEIVVPVSIANRHNPFMLDTGAPGVTFDRSLRRYLGQSHGTERRANLIGTTVYELCDPTNAFVGYLNIRSKSVVGCADLRKWRDEGAEVYGVIGMEVLKNCVLKLDPDDRSITLMKSAPPHSGYRVPIRIERSLPSVTVNIRGFGKANFIIDTGCTGPIEAALGWDLFNSIRARRLLGPTSSTTVRDATDEVPTAVGWLNDLSIDQFSHPSLRFFCHQGRVSNFLGLRFWSRYVMTVDFPNSVMYLKKSRQFDERLDDNPAGVSLARGWGETLIDEIEPGGAAEHAGLRKADTVLFVDGIDSSIASLFELRTALRARGRTVRLTCARSAERFAVELRIPDATEPTGRAQSKRQAAKREGSN